MRNVNIRFKYFFCFQCETETELLELHQTAKAIGLLSNVVRDAGQTQVAPGSRTVCGIGPGPCELIDQITGHLKLYWFF